MDRWLRLRLLAVGVSGALILGTAAIVAFTAPATRHAPATPPAAAPPPTCPSGRPPLADGSCAQAPADPLRDLAARKGLRLGTAVNVTALQANGPYREALSREFAATPENAMKWSTVEPVRGAVDYRAADQLVEFARQHDQVNRWSTRAPGAPASSPGRR